MKPTLTQLREVSIHKILGLVNTGRRVSISCPFGHRDRNPSFSLFPNNSFKCFSCGKHGGGAVDFCLFLGYSMKDCTKELAKFL
jgi:DNA primase